MHYFRATKTTILGLAVATALTASAQASTPRKTVVAKPVDTQIIALAAKYRSDAGTWKPAPFTYSLPAIPKQDAQRIISASWSAFGITGKTLQTNVRLNTRQAVKESGLRPQAIHIMVDPNNKEVAAGLFQLLPQTFSIWEVADHNDRFNPLDNSLAVVNAQVNADHFAGGNKNGILDGTSGWSAGR